MPEQRPDDAAAPAVPEQRAQRALPPDLPALLRRAFDTDTAHRLPRLHAAAALDSWDAGEHDPALRDAHTIATSAVVVGLPAAARAAKAAEEALRGWRAGDADSRRVLVEAVAELDVALAAQ